MARRYTALLQSGRTTDNFASNLREFTMNTSKNTILISGASGTIGSELLRQLKAAGADVLAGSSSGKTCDGVATRRMDFADLQSLHSAFQGVDTLFLLLPLQENMHSLASNAIAAAKAAGVKHIVRSSGAGADATSEVAIARVQGRIDQLLIDSGIPYTITRPSNFMQNYVNFFGGMLRGGTLYLPQGDGKIGFVDVRDIAAANAAILRNPAQHAGKVYTLTGSVALSNAEAMAQISTALGKQIAYVSVPDEAAIASMREMGMSAWSIDTMMSLHRVIAAGYASGVSNDIATLLGRPPIPFTQFVSDNLAAWR